MIRGVAHSVGSRGQANGVRPVRVWGGVGRERRALPLALAVIEKKVVSSTKFGKRVMVLHWPR